ncbi:MAG: peptidase, partial [Eggerthellaceae bacterium]|nr:peptidase [Eggerthellaceae bacterium]
KRLAELEQQNQGGQQSRGVLASTSTSQGPGGEWIHGSASAYGSGESTATGEFVTESSMGVSVVISRFPELRGRNVEIEYGGMSVFARVNDCGGLNGRDLDLQPGVYHAFGFDSPYAWGVRGVNYRYL